MFYTHSSPSPGSSGRSSGVRILLAASLLLLAMPAGARAAEAEPTEIEKLRKDLEEYKTQSEDRIRLMEDRLKTAEERVLAEERRLAESQKKVIRIESMAQSAFTRADKAAEEARGTSEAFRDFGSKPRAAELIQSGEPGFEYHGYLRAGAGVTGEGSDFTAFKAPGAWAKYRLGNEAETYGEMLFRYNFAIATNSDARYNVQIRAAFVTAEDIGFPQQDTFALPEAFVQARDAVAVLPDASFWAGERFYRRIDIHMNDFYLSDNRGYGGGVEDLQVGPTKVALAYIASNKDDINLDVQRLTKRSVDFRLQGIEVPGGEFRLWAAYGWVNGGTTPGGVAFRSQDGPAIGVLYDTKTRWDGLNKLTLQYGYDAYSTLTSTAFLQPEGVTGHPETFRATDHYTFQPNEHFTLQAAAIYQNSKNVARGEGADEWISAGVRPIVFFTKHLGLAFEAGWDHVKNDRENFEGSLYKLTLSPQLQHDPKYFGRPVLRLFGTYAFWDDSLRGRIGGPTYSGDTSGFSFGIQTEAWW